MDDEIRTAIAKEMTGIERRLLERAFLYDSPTVYREAIRDICREVRTELIHPTGAA